MITYPLNPSFNINFRYIPFTIKMSSSEDEEAEYSRARTLTKLIMESTRQFTDTIRMCEEDYPSKDPALNSGINLIILECNLHTEHWFRKRIDCFFEEAPCKN